MPDCGIHTISPTCSSEDTVTFFVVDVVLFSVEDAGAVVVVVVVDVVVLVLVEVDCSVVNAVVLVVDLFAELSGVS